MSLSDDPDFKKIKVEGYRQFLTNLLAGHNGIKSYQMAYPNASYRAAGVKATQLKKKYGHILERNAPLNPDKIEDVANETLHNLSLMAFADIGKMVDKEGVPLPLQQIPREVRMAITEIEVEGGRLKYRVGGKLKALEILAKIARLHQPETASVNIELISEEERKIGRAHV
mgnify:CR=1 FL=1